MKTFTCFLLAFAVAATASADIHQPPAADHGPTRKLGRGLSNVAFAVSELPVSIGNENAREGSNALTTGIVRGIGRTIQRTGYGVYEVVTFPFPTYKGKYSKPYKSQTLYKHGGYSEYAPELGTQSKYRYNRTK